MIKSKRSNYLIDKPFQIGFIVKYVLIIVITVIIVFSLFIAYYYTMDKIKKLETVITISQRGLVKYKGSQVFGYDNERIQIYKDSDGKFKCYKKFASEKYNEGDTVESVDESTLKAVYGPIAKVATRFSIIFWPLLLITIVLVVIITLFSIFFSHKMAGPIYRMRVSLDRMIDNDTNFIIKVRKDDFFINIIERLEKLRQLISKK